MLTALLLLGIASMTAAPLIAWSLTSDDAGEDEGTAADSGDVPEADTAFMGELLEEVFPSGPEKAIPGKPEGAEPPADRDGDLLAGIFRLTDDLAETGSNGAALPVRGPILSPGAGDTADTPAPVGDDLEPLLPGKGDEPDVPGPDDPSFDPLQPVTEDDFLDLAPFHPDAPGSLVAPGAGEPVDLPAFSPGDDLLEVTLYTDLPPEEINLTVSPSENQEDGVVTANDAVVAILRGAPEASLEDLSVVIQPSIGAGDQSIG